MKKKQLLQKSPVLVEIFIDLNLNFLITFMVAGDASRKAKNRSLAKLRPRIKIRSLTSVFDRTITSLLVLS